jgi:hypothetical protein
MQTTTKTSRKYLVTPIFGVLMGVVYLVAVWAGGTRAASAVDDVGVVAEVHPVGLQ